MVSSPIRKLTLSPTANQKSLISFQTQQYIKAGLLDEIALHLVPVRLGEGIRLFENIGREHIKLEQMSVIEDADVTHFRFRVLKQDTGKVTINEKEGNS